MNRWQHKLLARNQLNSVMILKDVYEKRYTFLSRASFLQNISKGVINAFPLQVCAWFPTLLIQSAPVNSKWTCCTVCKLGDVSRLLFAPQRHLLINQFCLNQLRLSSNYKISAYDELTHARIQLKNKSRCSSSAYGRDKQRSGRLIRVCTASQNAFLCPLPSYYKGKASKRSGRERGVMFGSSAGGRALKAEQRLKASARGSNWAFPSGRREISWVIRGIKWVYGHRNPAGIVITEPECNTTYPAHLLSKHTQARRHPRTPWGAGDQMVKVHEPIWWTLFLTWRHSPERAIKSGKREWAWHVTV